MPFLTQTDIASRLPNSFNTELVEDLLAQIESELIKSGLTFTGFMTTTRQIHADSCGQSIWDLLPFTSLSSVKIKQFNSDSETVLTANQDYRIIEHSNVQDIYTRLELIPRYKSELRDPQYLELTGLWGFMSTVPTDLKGVIARYIASQLTYQSLDYKTITRSKTGDSDVYYSDNSQEFVNSIIEYKPFLSILSKYQL